MGEPVRKKLRGSTASYVVDQKNKTFKCDVDELAEKYKNWGSVPRSIGDIKAMEISILAKHYLRLKKSAKLIREGGRG